MLRCRRSRDPGQLHYESGWRVRISFGWRSHRRRPLLCQHARPVRTAADLDARAYSAAAACVATWHRDVTCPGHCRLLLSRDLDEAGRRQSCSSRHHGQHQHPPG